MRLQSAGATTSPSVKTACGAGEGVVHTRHSLFRDSCIRQLCCGKCHVPNKRFDARVVAGHIQNVKLFEFDVRTQPLCAALCPEQPLGSTRLGVHNRPITPAESLRHQQIKKLFIVETAIDVLHAFRSTSFIGPCCAPLSPTSVLLDSANSIRLEPPVSATRFVSAFCNSSGERSVAQMSPTFRMSRVTCG